MKTAIKSLILAACFTGILAVPEGCTGDIEYGQSEEQCGFAGIGETQCEQLGCCWRDEQCFMWAHELAIPQKGIRVSDNPVYEVATTDPAVCSSTANAVSMGWDWSFAIDSAAEKCLIYSSRFHIYRSNGLWTRDENVVTFEQLTWDKGQRSDAEDFGNLYNTLDGLYMGCYPAVDTELPGNEEDVEVPRWDWEGNTAQLCVAACRAEGYQIAGVREGSKCFCTNRLLRRNSAASDATCDTPCPGDSQQNCGSDDFNAVYFVAPAPRFAACYNDTADIHQWDEWLAGSEKTVQQCIEACSAREDNTQRRYYHHYALVANNGDCFCADQKTLLENALQTSPIACMGRCQGDVAGQADQYCGLPGTAAAYETYQNLPQRPTWSHTPNDWHRPLARRMRFTETDDIPNELSTMTGVPTNIFTLFPELKSIIAPRLIVHATEAIIAPFQLQRCGAECWDSCGDIWFEDKIPDYRDTATIRAWYINLADLKDRVSEYTKRVYLHAQVVVIDSSIDFDFALSIRARTIVVDRSVENPTIRVGSEGPALYSETAAFNNNLPVADANYQKLVQQCARILVSKGDPDKISTAFEMLQDVSSDFSYDKEQAAFKVAARLTKAELSGVARAGYSHVPFFTKQYFRSKLQIHYVRIGNWNDNYKKIRDTGLAVDALLGYTEDMLDIFVSTNIGQWETIYEAQLLALQISEATYKKVYNNFSISRDQAEVAKEAFEEGLKDYKPQPQRRGIIGWIIHMVKMMKAKKAGGWNMTMVAQDLGQFIVTLDNLEDTMNYLFDCIEKIEYMMERFEYLNEILTNVLDAEELESVAGDVEYMAQLNKMLVAWDIMKFNSREILSYPAFQTIDGSQDYLTAIMDTCTWGKKLTETLIEGAENYRRVMMIQASIGSKEEMQVRYKEYIDATKDDNALRFALVNEMSDMQVDLRIDVNDLLLDFCDLVYYENQQYCSSGSQPNFDGDLDRVLLTLGNAMEDSLWGSGVPGSFSRPFQIQDTNDDPDCVDEEECPINIFRKTRELRFTIGRDHPTFIDTDRFRIGTIDVTAVGAKKRPDGPNSRFRIDIESSAPFEVRYQNTWYQYITRALKVTHEYNVDTGSVTFTADLYSDQSTNIHHRAPFTTWIMKAHSISNHIDLSEVEYVEIIFEGSAIGAFDGQLLE